MCKGVEFLDDYTLNFCVFGVDFIGVHESIEDLCPQNLYLLAYLEDLQL